MKYIAKSHAPKQLEDWFNSQPINQDGQRINCTYNQSLPSDVRKAIKDKLLQEQGWLCCYTGTSISEKKSHIEHFKPQSLCRQEGNYEDVNYRNLLAAYPGDRDSKCSFGAHAKEDWYDPELLVSPLHKQCESRFHFDEDGYITSTRNDDQAAKETIKKLFLNCDMLREWREQAIDEFFFPEGRELSESKLQSIVENGCCIRDKKGRYPKFCFVIEQVAPQILRKAKSDRHRRQAINKQ